MNWHWIYPNYSFWVLWVVGWAFGTEVQQLISNRKWGYFLRILLNWILYEIWVAHFGESESHKLVSFYTMCDLSRHLHMLCNYYNELYNNVVRDSRRCVFIIYESLACEEVTTLWPAKFSENGVYGRPESGTACVPMQLKNGGCPRIDKDLKEIRSTVQRFIAKL